LGGGLTPLFGWVGRVIIVREIDPADLALFDEWYDALRAGAVAGREAALVVGREALGYSLRNPGPLKRRIAVGAFEDDRVLGAMLPAQRQRGRRRGRDRRTA